MKKILVLNGPNLDLLGKRDPKIYGTQTLKDIEDVLCSKFNNNDLNFCFYQSNHEGDLIDKINKTILDHEFDAIIINPGALAHYSYSLRDSIEACDIPVVEVHLSDVKSREKFRQNLVLSEVCKKTIVGLGNKSYIEAVKFLLENF